MTGLFVSLEGGEGSGKSTQVKRLADYLSDCFPQREIVCTREPGGTKQAEAIRKMLVTGATDKFLPATEALLMSAARAEHVAEVIQPALCRDAFVICDRYIDSTFVYQGFAHNIEVSTLEEVHQFACGGLMPDLTLLLDVPPELGLLRALGRSSSSPDAEIRFEGKGVAFHEKVREGFLELAQLFSTRFVVIDASGTPDETDDIVIEAVKARLAVGQK